MSRQFSSRVSFRDVLGVLGFRWLWIADLQSNVGDQLARVALAILVFQRTDSAFATAMTYALSFLPAIVGGALLSGLADRFPRRDLMVACDLIRAALVGAMALPGMPIWAISGLLVLSVLSGSPFTAAQSAMLPDILDGDRYVVATGLRTLTSQLAQLGGFAGGGLLVSAIGARGCLAVDATTFVASAALLWFKLPGHVAAGSGVAGNPSGGKIESQATTASGPWASTRMIAADRRLRAWLGLACVFGFYVSPEGIAAPFAADIGGGSKLVGLLMAAAPAGSALGAVVFVRLISPADRPRLAGPMAAAAGIPLMLFAMHPGGALAVVLLFASGILSIYTIEAITSFTRGVPSIRRGQAVGIASSFFLLAQGVGLLIAGWLTELIGASRTIACSGVLGFLVSVALAASLSLSAPQARASESAAP